MVFLVFYQVFAAGMRFGIETQKFTTYINNVLNEFLSCGTELKNKPGNILPWKKGGGPEVTTGGPCVGGGPDMFGGGPLTGCGKGAVGLTPGCGLGGCCCCRFRS